MWLHFNLYSVDVLLSYGSLLPFHGGQNGQRNIWVNILETIAGYLSQMGIDLSKMEMT